MKERLSHRDRLQSIREGILPDRYAASFWRHFFHREHGADGTVDSMVRFQQTFDWDFVKINPRANYHVQDWGVKLKYSTDEFGKHERLDWPIKSAADWHSIQPLSLKAPNLAEHLLVVSRIRKALGPDVPILMTMFTPLSLAGRMLGPQDDLVRHLRENPKELEAALSNITDTFSRYAVELRNAGADGLFYATTHWASSDRLSWPEYQRFGVPYDTAVLAALDDGAFNLLHVCGNNNYLSRLCALAEYRAELVNWDSADPTNLPLDRALDKIGDRTAVGGVDYTGWLVRSEPDEMKLLLDGIKKRFSPAEVIIGPGCAIAPDTPAANLAAIRENL